VDDASLLRLSELFQEFDPDEMALIVAEASPVQLQRGEVVFEEGAPADRMFVVRNGRVAISKHSTEDKDTIIALRGAGDLFGEMSLFDGWAPGGRSPNPGAVRAGGRPVRPTGPSL